MISGPSTSSQGIPPEEIEPETQYLLTEAIETENRCFNEGCQRTERYRVPLSTRKMLLNQYKYYVPKSNRLCDQHLVIKAWDFLDSLRSHYLQTFTAKHIQDMMSLKDVVDSAFLRFENIDDMEDNAIHTWIGLNKAQFNQMFTEVPQLLEIPKATLALAAYLMKLRTGGDSNERLATLLKVSRRTVEMWLHQVRYLLTEYFVPRNLGLNHIYRQQLVARNLAIPQSLFASFEGVDRPIVIFDGTYCYVEKSSNYLYQKKNLYLHKYRNLVKPFLLVACDGHIIEVSGPYPATESDANIMKALFQNEDGELRSFFEAGDVFILDRGFRDAVPFLESLGYKIYTPESLEQGETQLPTVKANKAVTICRWVVEAVNGRFKRDFKLLRQDYFNTASKNLMVHFEVAAALINAFHPPILNRSDAQEILQLINRYMHVDNRLSTYVISNNLNRRRAQFQPIDLILVSLGTYQIKQARSYYGEHVRANGSYVIEVCREVDSDLLQELSTTETTWLLRGRIKSRHISNRIYFVYILVDSSLSGRDAIIQYCCNCIVGKRTVGCCAHTMSIIWYLGWARYQDNIVPPAERVSISYYFKGVSRTCNRNFYTRKIYTTK
ncbi:hypothetical protein ABMA27_003200 [Loxostege sticticalis]|uniref:DDE Tnp4 domain-containing protein n=1 Tax=Loxostege sticticalis TaxID=481309 RepID=A0ABR3HSB3_LOXSC